MTRSTGKLKSWTRQQYDLLQCMGAAQSRDWDAIAEACGHPKDSCRTTLNRLLREIAQDYGVSFGKQDPRNPKRYWSALDVVDLVRLRCIEHRTFPAIDLALGRPEGASAQKFRSLPPDAPPAPNGIERRAIHAPKYVPEHTSLTAAQLGDPLPGRSVLDRIRAGILEPPVYMGRAARYPAKVTLTSEPPAC